MHFLCNSLIISTHYFCDFWGNFGQIGAIRVFLRIWRSALRLLARILYIIRNARASGNFTKKSL